MCRRVKILGNLYRSGIKIQKINLQRCFLVQQNIQVEVNDYYKDQKCAVNKNPSVRIESAGSKTCDNCLLKNGSAVSNCSIVCW